IKATPGGVIHSITFSDLPSASDEPEMRSASFSGASTADTRQASGSYLNNSRSAGAETTVSGAAFYQSENSRIPRTETSGTSVKDSLEAAASTSAHSGDRPGNAASANKSSAPSRDRIAALADQKDVRQIFFVAEQYLKRPLTCAEQEDFVYYYDTLKFSSDLIIYLLTTVVQAKQESNLYNKNYFTILNTFGIKGRSPAGPEIEIMSRWFNEYDFTLDIIVEACNRTIRQIHQPSFEYANKILRQWNKNGVSSLDDVKRLDQIRTEEQQRRAENCQFCFQLHRSSNR
ncbi:MAG: hypothetical protein BHW31_00045, partial [Firmicutes bacterium CAG:110_56_8]